MFPCGSVHFRPKGPSQATPWVYHEWMQALEGRHKASACRTSLNRTPTLLKTMDTNTDTDMTRTHDTPAAERLPTPAEWRTLRRIKTAARVSIGLVWVWEGLVPKMLFPNVVQYEMVHRSGWWLGSPEQTLWWLGAAMVVAGAAIMSGVMERTAAAISTLAVLVLMVLVIGNHPEALHDPFGGLVKDVCLFTCAALVWWWPRGERRAATPAAP